MFVCEVGECVFSLVCLNPRILEAKLSSPKPQRGAGNHRTEGRESNTIYTLLLLFEIGTNANFRTMNARDSGENVGIYPMAEWLHHFEIND